MDDREHTYEEAIQRLSDLFPDDSVPVNKRECRKYVLELEDGKPVFRRADASAEPELPRDEIELALRVEIDELFGDDLVPQKPAISRFA